MTREGQFTMHDDNLRQFKGISEKNIYFKIGG